MADANDKLKTFIKAEAIRLGFSLARFAAADAPERLAADLAGFVGAGYHGSMDWMVETAERRADPKALWPDVKSIVVLAMNYGPDSDPLASTQMPDRGNISVYARNRDYHDIIKGKLKELAGKIASRSGADVKVFVDTAPVMESRWPCRRVLAGRATHQSRQPRSRLLVLSGLDLHDGRNRARRTRTRPLRLLPRLSRCLPDGRLSGSRPDRRAALHFLSDHRAQGHDRCRISRGDGKPHLWL